MKKEELAWAAGLLEGEGSFLRKPDGHAPFITCQMTDLDVLERLKDLFGGTIIETKTAKNYYKKCWRWALFGPTVASVLENIKPWLMSRRKSKVDEILEHWYDHLDRKKAYEEIQIEAATRYINKEGSLRQIAKEYNFSYESLRRKVIELTPVALR